MIRVAIPSQLQNLARVGSEVTLKVKGQVTVASVLDALESQYPMLRGTIRDQVTLKRRPLIRFFACGQDLSQKPMETLLPEAVVKGTEPLLIIGAIAGG